LKRPLILISNDDGVHAKGLKELIEAVRPFGDLFVVAPETGESGMSHAITIKNPLRVSKISEEKGLTIYSCSGTPVDSVKIALNKLIDRKPDLLLSGINHGSNASISVIYSGTLGAAREGCINRIPSIGFSVTDHDKNADFTTAFDYVRTIVKDVIENGLEEDTFLNVNIPAVEKEKIKGIRVSSQTNGVWKQEYEERVDPHEGVYYWLTGFFDNYEKDNKDSDEWALNNNYVAIVPIKINSTNFDYIKNLKNRY
jgi:5'-nucleotidase